MKLLMEGFRSWIGSDKEVESEEEFEHEEENEEGSQEANLAILALNKYEGSRKQALMMFETLAQIDEIDLDLLAAELNHRLLEMWNLGIEQERAIERKPQSQDVFANLLDWYTKIEEAKNFISGGGVNREFELPQDEFRFGSLQGVISDALKQTVAIWNAQ